MAEKWKGEKEREYDRMGEDGRKRERVRKGEKQRNRDE